MNLTCVICSDLFVPSDDVHMTPCGHAFHYVCVVQWFERSKTCPQCRNKCLEKSLIKVYFNVAANVEGPEDNATLLQKLDNMTLSLREKEKALKEHEEKQSTFKTDRKKMKKTLVALEEKVQKQEFTISAYKQEVDMLRGDRTQLLKAQTELEQLKKRLELMATIEYVVSSTAKEVEDMLANNCNPQTLAVSVATLKRELKSAEQKRNEMRDRMKSIQNDLLIERAKRKELEDQLSVADSEIYRLEQEVKRLEKNANEVSTTESGSDGSIVLDTPEQLMVKRKRLDADLDKSTPLSAKVRKIQESDSPYFTVRSSSIGLAPLLRPGLSASAALGKGTAATKLTKAHSDLAEKFSIFRNPRANLTTKLPANKNLVYDGLGGSKRVENFPDFPEPKTTPPSTSGGPVSKSDKSKNSISERLKAGKFTRYPSKNLIPTTNNDADENVLDIAFDD